MNEDAQIIIELAKEKMEKALHFLETDLSRIRAGKANTHILDGILVEYYGNPVPLAQVSNISTPDPKTIAIQPWEKTMIAPIEKAIMASQLGITPVNNGEIIRINIPMLTEERRKELVKQVKHEGENAKVSLRNARRDANDELKKLQKEGMPEDELKRGELEVQKITDDHTSLIEKLIDAKEKEILTV
ncbi:MAG: ribosome recycling factor [Bacteroidales bacterium]|nr:ribosome recycling factor [Bacteroidales bacterium]MCB8999819.1 ribosome recycling factor [Bacteroidales bacterium]